ncbi:hypothetical protein PAEPH01_1292 [Pancytospora epiphaga]|nr:hypothetical protein PAEPH01_1292 [Pancytospora epiphaga]
MLVRAYDGYKKDYDKRNLYYLATQCDRMLYHDYTRRHNEVVRCIYLDLKYIIYVYYHVCVHTLFKR